MKKRLSFPVAIVVLALTAYLYAGELIQLIRPQSFQVTEAEQTIQGVVEAPSPTRIAVEVQPFVASHTAQPRIYEFDVISGHFQGKVKLFPGMNLLSVSTLGKQISIHSVIFLVSPEQPYATQKNWGDASLVVFTKPQSLRTTANKIVIEGVVAMKDVTKISLMVLNNRHFQILKGASPVSPSLKTPPPKVYVIGVKNMRFEATVELEDGHNVILARPGDKPVKYENIGLKSIIYERSNPAISLQEPTTAKGNIRVWGEVQAKEKDLVVGVKVSALVKDKNTEQLYLHTFADTSVKTEGQGRFQIEIPWSTENSPLEIKDFPIVETRLGNNSATKVLFDW